MRDHGNMPALDWRISKPPFKAKALIVHEEPVILQMPSDFDASLDGQDFSGVVHRRIGIVCNCDARQVLRWLSRRKREPGMEIVAEACAWSGSLVDVDCEHNRLIVHD